MDMNRKFAVFVAGVLTLGAMAQPPGERLSAEEYIALWKDVAVQKMQEHGIPASITLAQGLLESGNGNSELARKANNHFGIKCHSDWKGAKVYHDDDRRGECFRKYRDAAESFEDHSKFLMKPRYAGLFELRVTDYKGWAHGLRKAGYATDPRYPQKLIDLIERYRLNELDRGGELVARKPEHPSQRPAPSSKDGGDVITIGGGREVEKFEGRIKFVRARAGDTFDGLARELELTPGMLARWNDLQRNSALGAGQRVYIQPKRNKSKSTSVHVARQGESLWGVGHLYGVKLDRLVKYNDLPPDAILQEGQRIHLRKP